MAVNEPSRGGCTLLERLCQRAWEFDCLQAIWFLDRYICGTGLEADTTAAGPTIPVGERGPIARERLRFRPDVSLGFPPTDLRRVFTCHQPDTDLTYYVLEVAFLGLYGVSTPLPLHYAIDILRAAEPGGTAGSAAAIGREALPDSVVGVSPTRDFLDLLHHRLVSLFYRAWLKYHYERMFGSPQRDLITGYLRLLIGCPSAYDQTVLGVPPIRLLRYAGLLTQRPKSAVMLEGLLTDYWSDVPVRVRQFVGQWVPLEPSDLNRCGLANSRLGVDLTVGEQVYDLGGAFCVCIGPLDWKTYLAFVPGGPRFRQTRDLTRLYICDPLAFNIEVTLRPGEVPEMQLTSDEGAGCLGLTTWVRTADLGQTTVTFTAGDDTGLPQLVTTTRGNEETP